MPQAAYDERLSVPLRWWALATMFLASVLVAFLVATPLWLALAVTLLLTALVVGVFTGYGGARITVADGWLRVGRARIETGHLGGCEPLDPVAMRRWAGRDADARAHLVLRPYLRCGVRVVIADPSDPTPYWLVSTRHPARLAAALDTAHHPVRGGYDRQDSAARRTDAAHREGDS